MLSIYVKRKVKPVEIYSGAYDKDDLHHKDIYFLGVRIYRNHFEQVIDVQEKPANTNKKGSKPGFVIPQSNE